MDPGYRSPLIDLFRREETDRDVRLAGALGRLRLPALEQIALLMTLLEDRDSEVARTAAATLDRLPAPAVARFLARPEVPGQMRTFFTLCGIEPVPDTSGDSAEPELDLVDEEASAGGPANEEPPATMLASLPVVERLKLATKGTREQRAQLIRDSNRMVAVAVLSSPKVNESEIEAFAKMANVAEEVLRIISGNRAWMKNYGVALGLAKNPKTPPGISAQILARLNERDVKALTTDRNVPEMLRLAARRAMTRVSR